MFSSPSNPHTRSGQLAAQGMRFDYLYRSSQRRAALRFQRRMPAASCTFSGLNSWFGASKLPSSWKHVLGATPFCVHVGFWLPSAGMFLGHRSDGPSSRQSRQRRNTADVMLGSRCMLKVGSVLRRVMGWGVIWFEK